MNLFKEINIMAMLPRDIEIAENGTQEPNKVRIKVVFTNIHHLYYEQL